MDITRTGNTYRSVLCLLIPLMVAGLCEEVAAQDPIIFPAHAQDLVRGSYWAVDLFDEGCCTIDFNVRRWDGSAWQKENGSSTNEQDYDWGVPYYAPADGEIASCWRNFPDDPRPGKNPENNNIFAGGNHVVIITDDDYAISVLHMKSGTIPANLCPPNPDDREYPTSLAKPISGERRRIYLPGAGRA